jgi:hypothetical protein
MLIALRFAPARLIRLAQISLDVVDDLFALEETLFVD